MPEYLSPEEDERQETAEVTPSALAILNQSEHASMVQTANVPGNRRKLAEFESKLMAYANHSQPIALLMFYSLPRAGKQIIGPSVRFSEIVAPCWRNCAVAGRVVGDAQSTVTAQGIFIDYESNMRNSVEVPRRITDKDGRRYSEDMIITTSNAAMSVARRNAVLKGGVPQALWTPSYEAAQLSAVGKNETHAQRVASAMDYLHKMGLTEWQILNAVGVAGVKELETEHLVTLRVLCSEIKRGEKSIEQVFGSDYDKEIDSMFVQLKMNSAQQTMLRNSYLGRAEKLVAYLRDRLGPAAAGRAVTEPEQSRVEEVRTRTPDWTPTVAPGMSGEPGNKEPFTPANGNAAYETKMTPDEVAQHGASVARTVVVSTPDGGTSAATVMSGGTQTATGEPVRRRGRPTREEMARRRAQEQGVLEPQPEQTEEEARQEAESLVGQTDQFAF